MIESAQIPGFRRSGLPAGPANRDNSFQKGSRSHLGSPTASR
jgi:hypothetical protein